MIWLALLAGCVSDPPGPEPVKYTVKRGDTLFVIAREHGVDLAALKAANRLDGDRIEVDQVLVIPDAPAVVAARPRKRASRSVGAALQLAPAPSARPALELPAPKRCLAGPDGEGLGEQGVVASAGLDPDDVRVAMNGFLPNVQPCLAELDAQPSGALTLAITVGCDGRVARVAVDGQDDWPDGPSRCIADTLGYAPFPAHDLPDGDTFLYPIRMR